MFNLSTIKSCLTRSLFNIVSFSGVFTLAKISGLVLLNALSCAIRRVPFKLFRLDCLCGIIKLPIAQTVPTVTKEIAIIAMILFSKFVCALYSDITSLNFYWTACMHAPDIKSFRNYHLYTKIIEMILLASSLLGAFKLYGYSCNEVQVFLPRTVFNKYWT